MESVVGYEPVGADEMSKDDTRCRICVRSRRKRKTDIGGVSEKAAIDGLVYAGLLEDDSTDYVKGITHIVEKTEKGEMETTTLTLIWETQEEQHDSLCAS